MSSIRLNLGVLAVTAVLAAAVGAAVGGSVAVVSAHGGDSSKVHSCVLPYVGLIQIVAPGAACPPPSTPLDWSRAGESTSYYTTLSPSASVSPVEASCDSGDIAVWAEPAPGASANGIREQVDIDTWQWTWTVPPGFRQLRVYCLDLGATH